MLLLSWFNVKVAMKSSYQQCIVLYIYSYIYIYIYAHDRLTVVFIFPYIYNSIVIAPTDLWNRPAHIHNSITCISMAERKTTVSPLLTQYCSLALNHRYIFFLISMVSCQKGPTRHAYAWQIGHFWQDTLDIFLHMYSPWTTAFTCRWHLVGEAIHLRPAQSSAGSPMIMGMEAIEQHLRERHTT